MGASPRVQNSNSSYVSKLFCAAFTRGLLSSKKGRVPPNLCEKLTMTVRDVGDSSLICCVCLDESNETLQVLPCCGRQASSSTRCCTSCLLRISATTNCCPVCRAVGLRLQHGRAVLLPDAPDESMLVSRVLLMPLWHCILSVVAFVWWPLGHAFDQALESVLSRGPV